jgi:signal transduction histidine kinase/CHASE2 domain-containing sensor protein
MIRLSQLRLSATPFTVLLLVATLTALASWGQWFSTLDRAYYDLLLRQHRLEYPEDIVIIAIDEASLDEIGAWPWPRNIHAQLLEQLSLADVAVFDIIFSEPGAGALVQSPSNNQSANDALFAQRIGQNKKVILPIFIDEQQYRGILQEVLPLPILSDAASALGHVHLDYSRDGLVRGLFLGEGLGKPYWRHIALATAEFLGEVPAGLTLEPVNSALSPYQIYQNSHKNMRFIGAADSIYRFSYIDILNGSIGAKQLKNKRIFIGASAKGLGDDVPTPMGLMAGVEFIANAYQAVRSNGFVTAVPQFYQVVSDIFVVMLVCSLLGRLPPMPFLAGNILFGFFWVALSAVLYLTASLWKSPFPVVFGIAVFYPIWSWRRIEIALDFLRNELSALRQSPTHSVFSLTSLKTQLQGLKELNVLKAFSLKVEASTIHYPDVFREGNFLQTGFSSDEIDYSLTLEATAEHTADAKIDLAGVTSTLLADLAETKERSSTSYELVGQTIEEIYAIKGIAEQAQTRMNKSMASLQDAVVIIDCTARVVFVNARSREFFGENLIGKSALQLKQYFDPFVWLSLLKGLMLQHSNIYQELDAKNGKRLLCQAAAIADEQSDASALLLFVFTDVTQLRALERSKNEALAFLSHDMRSPIVSQLSLIESYKNKQRQSNYDPIVDQLAKFAQMSLRYADNFLQLSRAENLDQGQFQLVDMHSVVDGAYAQTIQIAAHKNIALLVERDDHECWVEGDANLLERAIVNLLSNAIQYSEKNTCVKLLLKTQGDILIEISDEGRGIDAAIIPELFEPYFRANEEQQLTDGGEDQFNPRSSTHGSNAGLGLSFVHTVVKRHGGDISVVSELGRGSTFAILLPAAKVE